MLFNSREKNPKWWIFTAMCGAVSIVFLDQTAISVALPAMQKSVHATNIMLQWMINAYLVALAAVVIFGGKLGDVYGHKRIFLTGIIVFVIASISCAASQTAGWVVLSRAAQGIGGALMIPATFVILTNAFEEKERGKIIGLYYAIASIFLSLGPLLSGLLVHYLSWRWVFWINLPISLFSIVLAFKVVPSAENLISKPLDWFGFVTSVISITTLVVALIEGQNLGWFSFVTLGLLMIAVVFAVAFIVSEKKAIDPIVYLPLFSKRDFLSANICLFVFQCAFSSIIFWAILFQNVMHYSAVASGFFYLPVTLPVMFMAPLGGILRDRFGARFPASLGTMLVTLGALWMSIFIFQGNYWAIFPGIVLFGLGPALIYSSTIATAMSSVAHNQKGMASGITNGVRQLGSAIGAAIIGAVISNLAHINFWHGSALIFAFAMSMLVTALLAFVAFVIGLKLPNKV